MIELQGRTIRELKRQLKEEYASQRVDRYTVSHPKLNPEKIELTPLEFEYLAYLAEPQAERELERILKALRADPIDQSIFHKNPFSSAVSSLAQKLFHVHVNLRDWQEITVPYILLKRLANHGEASAILEERTLVPFWGC